MFSKKIPLLSPAYAGGSTPDDWQNWKIKCFRDIRAVEGVKPHEQLAACPVIGDSMRAHGITHGGLIVFKLFSQPAPGKISLWQTPHGRTIKFARANEDNTITLHNGGDWQQTWQADEVQHIGVVVRFEKDF